MSLLSPLEALRFSLVGDKLQRDIFRWLSPPDPWQNHNIACELRHSGTAAWFIQGITLSEWRASGPSSLLWIHGKRQFCVPALIIAEADNQNFCICSGFWKECSLVC
jgi:hypothetical protein